MTNELRRVKRAGEAWETVAEDESGGGGSQTSAVVTLTAEQVAGLSDTPVELVPAQPGKLLAPLFVALSYSPGETPYTASGGYIEVGISSQAAAHLDVSPVYIGAAAILAALDEYSIEGVWTNTGQEFQTLPVNEAIVVFGASDYDAVDGDGTVTAAVVYSVIDYS